MKYPSPIKSVGKDEMGLKKDKSLFNHESIRLYIGWLLQGRNGSERSEFGRNHIYFEQNVNRIQVLDISFFEL